MSSMFNKFVRPALSFVSLTCVFCVAAVSLTLASPPVQAQERTQDVAQAAVAVKDYDVFVDPQTAFAFIKLPSGWKFIGKLDAEQLRHLPQGTLTALLQPEAAQTRTLLAKANTATVK